MALSARAFVEERYDWAHIAAEMHSALKDLL
jgi:hypothetical protein